MDEYEGHLAQVQRDDDINLAMVIEERILQNQSIFHFQ